MPGEQGNDGLSRPPSRRELRAARRRAHEIEKERRDKQPSGGKADKKSKGGQQDGGDENRHRR